MKSSKSTLAVVKVKRRKTNTNRKKSKSPKKKTMRKSSSPNIVIEIKNKTKRPRKKRSKSSNEQKRKKKSTRKKKKSKQLTFNKCKSLFMKSALKNNKENLEVINNELKTLLLDVSAMHDVSPNNIEVLSARIADMNSPDYNKDTHIKFQFLMAMKQTMEIGDLIQVEAKPSKIKANSLLKQWL